MIPQRLRLPKNRITYLLHKGKRLGTPYLNLKFLATNKTESHFCVIVSAKIEPLAIKRNKLRRQIYETIRLHHQILTKTFDIILIAKPSLNTVAYKELEKVIISLFGKLQHG